MTQLFETEKRPITDADRIKLGTELAAVDQRLAEVKAEKSGVSKVYGRGGGHSRWSPGEDGRRVAH